MAFPTPLSAFSFDEASGTTALSEVGGYTLSAVSPGTAWGSGKNASGANGKFTGVIGTALSTWSIQFDVYITSINSWSSIIEGDDFYLEFNGSGLFDVFIGGADGGADGTTLATGTWHTIGITHDDTANQTKIYTDGSLTTTKTHSSTTGTAPFDTTFEICGSSSQPMNGRLDNLRLWSSVLSQAQLNEAAATAVGQASSGIRIWNGTSWFGSSARIRNGAAWVAATAYPLAPGSGSSSTLFPRFAGMLIGDPHNYDQTSYQQQIARLDMAILGVYNTWAYSGKTPAQVVSEIKAYNANILLGNYTIMTEVPTSTSDTATADLRAKLSAEHGPGETGDWWAYNAAGQHTDWSGGTYPVNDTNMTLQTTPDANGDRWPQWLAKRDNSLLLSTAAWDIWYSDNNFWQPRSNADWDRNGTNDDANSTIIQDLWRNGQRAYYDTAIALQPGMMLMVNADNDLDGSLYPPAADPFTQYKNLLGGAFLEHIIGESWSPETWGGWSTMMGWYNSAVGNLLSPKACIFDAYMGNNTADYQLLRYSFASSLMNDGYFSTSTDYNQVLWYDEYDLAGTGTTKWLGQAIDGPQTSPWQNGVYRRRFNGGMVLINPKGNGSKTVTVGAGYHRFSGTQEPTVNNGQTVTSTVTLADRDGLFLVKS